ncbi:MAG TPA: hypothetical protein ENK52_00255 [Saprospiraceae bacterium]|nr:hypothetical protein [Saprospiraceae bacterium]
MSPYKLDRTAFKIQSFQQADNNRSYWLSKTPLERLAAAWYLSCSAYNVNQEQIKMDRTAFKMRKRK